MDVMSEFARQVLMFSGVDTNNLDVMYEGFVDLFRKGVPTKENILEIMAAPKSVREKEKKETGETSEEAIPVSSLIDAESSSVDDNTPVSLLDNE